MTGVERRSYSGESPHEKVKAAIETLEQGIDEILTSESFCSYLTSMARFHSYSFGNILLIRAQRPEATRVAGYHKWLELGRQVKKGEQGIKILIPFKRRAVVEEEIGDIVVKGFGMGTVIDVVAFRPLSYVRGKG